MRVKRLKNSRIKFCYDEDSILIKIPPKNLIKSLENLIESLEKGSILLLIMIIPFVIFFLLSWAFIGFSNSPLSIEINRFILFLSLLLLSAAIEMLSSILFLLLTGEFSLRINKTFCRATWSIFNINYKSIAINFSEIIDVRECFTSNRSNSQLSSGIKIKYVSSKDSIKYVKYGNRQEINLENLLITTNEGRWLIVKIRKFLGLKPIKFPKLERIAKSGRYSNNSDGYSDNSDGYSDDYSGYDGGYSGGGDGSSDSCGGD